MRPRKLTIFERIASDISGEAGAAEWAGVTNIHKTKDAVFSGESPPLPGFASRL